MADGVDAPATAPLVARPRHEPALDGLRGLALGGVVLYHCGFSFAVGGYLAVSTFFTLSGFLIGGILVRALGRDGRIALRTFWARRARRLLAASFLVLAAVSTVYYWLFATPLQQSQLPGAVIAAASGVVNLWFIGQHADYGASFADPSPVMHFWSLAVEQQLYLLVPLLILALWRAGAGRARQWSTLTVGLTATAVGLTALSVALPVDDQWRYLSTVSRAPELLLGAAAAVAVSRTRRFRPGRWLVGVGAAALVVQVATWTTVPQDTGWLYRGGFLAYASLSVVVILAATTSEGVVRRVLGARALRVLGERSYSVYLWHWPLLLAIDHVWPAGSTWGRAAIALSLTAVLSELTYRHVEAPVRAGRWPSPGRGAPAAVLGLAGVVVIALLVARAAPERIDFAAEAAAFEQSSAGARSADGPRVLTVGDSTALLMGMGLGFWAQDTGRASAVGGDAELGCPVARFARLQADPPVELSRECTDWESTWPALVRGTDPDLVLVSTGTFDIADAQLPDGTVGSVGDPAVDRFVVSELTRAVDILGARGAVVVLVQWPPAGDWAAPGAAERARLDRQRMLRFHELQALVASTRPDQVRVLDLGRYLGDRVHDRSLRPDGTHIPTEQAYELFRDGLGDAVLDEWSDAPIEAD